MPNGGFLPPNAQIFLLFIRKHFAPKLEEGGKSFPDYSRFGMAVFAIGKAIGSISTPARRLDASGLGGMPFYQLHIRAGETTHLVPPSGGRKSRTFVQIPSISVHPGNPTNVADTNFFSMQSFQKQLVGFAGAGRVTDAKVPG